MLRRLELADLARFQAYRRDPDVGEFQGWEPESDHEAARFIEDMNGVDFFPRGAWVQLGIADKYTDDLIGDVGICVSADGEKAEIGFTVDRVRKAPAWALKPCEKRSASSSSTLTSVGSSPSSTNGTCERIDWYLVPAFRSLRASIRCFADSPASRMSGLSRGPTQPQSQACTTLSVALDDT